jgi:hypothetical protein
MASKQRWRNRLREAARQVVSGRMGEKRIGINQIFQESIA